MPDEACPLPGRPAAGETDVIARTLGLRRVAVVGMSDKPDRPAHYVPAYLHEAGYTIIPVNPTVPSVLGLKSYASLAELDSPPDLVLVFRRAEFCPAVAEQAVQARAKALWLQSGIRSDDARKIAESAGLDFVQDRCMMVEHRHRSH